jgi:anti-anti-sigma factor
VATIGVQIQDKQLSATIEGHFSFEDNYNFRQITQAVEDEKVSAVTVELSRLQMLDSAALGMLMMLRKRCEEHHIALTLMNPSGNIRKIFELSRFYDLFNITG